MIREIMEKRIATTTTTKEKLFNIGIMLFSTKGYHGVGIREICREVDIKESSFYNHFKGKAALLDAILDAFQDHFESVTYTEEEINQLIASKDVDGFIEYNMRKFASAYGFPDFHPTLLLVYMERFTNEKAHRIIMNTPYNRWKEPTLTILNAFMDKGIIREMDLDGLIMEYYFALSGIIDDFIQKVAWDEPFMDASIRIQEHMDYYKELLKG